MAYITPNNRILLLHNVPIDKEYENTMWWISQDSQTNTMRSFTKYTCAPTTYQRVNRNTCRVEHNAETLYDVNYMMFQNTNFGNKWFYAFVEKIDYINDAVSEITYRLDEIQTWYFDYTPMYSFVERCHSATDDIGDNIVDEPLAVGEYVCNRISKVDELDSLCVVILSLPDTSVFQSSDVKVWDRIVSGCVGRAFNYTSVAQKQAINAYLGTFASAPDNVVAMYVLPKVMITGINSSTGAVNPLPDTGSDGLAGVPIEDFQSGAFVVGGTNGLLPLTGQTTLDGYTPKNNKMYTYPYNFLHVDNNSGSSLDVRYEFFDQLKVRFGCYCSGTLPVTCKLYPIYYKGSGVEGNVPTPYTPECLTLDNFPMCSWNSDYFKGWLIQNSVPMAANLAGSMFNYNAMIGSMNPIQQARAEGSYARMSPANQVANILGETYQASIHADILKGGYANGNINIAHHLQNYYYSRMSINSQHAEIIDNYFTRYGYAQNRVMLPPRHNRTQFTYVKTIGCKISGSIPCDSEEIICKAFDNGITFWTNTTNVGNYLVNNGLLT